MLNFVKIHWFGLSISLLGILYLMFFALIAFSPRQDKLERGFIPCTKAMMTQMLDCPKNKAICFSEAIFKSTVCDAGVIAKGVKNWLNGEQPTPWANYLFEPELDQPAEHHPELDEFYEQNKNIREDMQLLEKARLDLEGENDEQAKPEE